MSLNAEIGWNGLLWWGTKSFWLELNSPGFALWAHAPKPLEVVTGKEWICDREEVYTWVRCFFSFLLFFVFPLHFSFFPFLPSVLPLSQGSKPLKLKGTRESGAMETSCAWEFSSWTELLLCDDCPMRKKAHASIPRMCMTWLWLGQTFCCVMGFWPKVEAVCWAILCCEALFVFCSSFFSFCRHGVQVLMGISSLTVTWQRDGLKRRVGCFGWVFFSCGKYDSCAVIHWYFGRTRTCRRFF